MVVPVWWSPMSEAPDKRHDRPRQGVTGIARNVQKFAVLNAPRTAGHTPKWPIREAVDFAELSSLQRRIIVI